MHPFELTSVPNTEWPNLFERRYFSAVDVADYCASNHFYFHGLYPDVWHIDGRGRVRCTTRCSSLDGLRWWPTHPESLIRSRQQGVAEGNCPARWVIVEPRVLRDKDVGEVDVAGYVAVQGLMAELGVEVIDAVVISDEGKWWSMRELTTGRLDWPLNQPVRAKRLRRVV